MTVFVTGKCSQDDTIPDPIQQRKIVHGVRNAHNGRTKYLTHCALHTCKYMIPQLLEEQGHHILNPNLNTG